jgi:hypothetical protein
MARKRTWIITTSEERPLRAIAKDVRDAGLEDGHVLEEVGCITGSASERVVAKVRKVRGVVDVSPDSTVDIGPPDSSETW